MPRAKDANAFCMVRIDRVRPAIARLAPFYASISSFDVAFDLPLLFQGSNPPSTESSPAQSSPASNNSLFLLPSYKPPAPRCCSLCTYCLETTFQAFMYFSRQAEKHCFSPLDMEEPGVGMQRSKQCSLSFCTWHGGQPIVVYFLPETMRCVEDGWRHYWGGDAQKQRTSTRARAFAMAAS